MAGPSLLLITDRRQARLPLTDVLRAAFDGGCRWLMVREKDLRTAELRPLLAEIMALAAPYGATISVNGDYTAASLCGAAGVHLPAGEPVADIRRVMGAQRLIGSSAHSLAEAQTAAESGADYVTLSPIFLTQSKPGYGPALGLEQLAAITPQVTVPVLALGGVSAANAAACVRAGAAGVAVMGEVMRADDPGAVVAALIAALAAA